MSDGRIDVEAMLRAKGHEIADANFDAAQPNGQASNSGQPSELVARHARDIEPEPVTWLWAGRLALGKQTVVAGDPGGGKSQLSLAIAAAVTTGGEWPCGEGRSPLGNVVILAAEDGPADTIVPRLMAAGADRKRVWIISAVRAEDGKGHRSFSLQTDLQLLENLIRNIGGVSLVIIDPVSSYLGRKIDGHSNTDIRGVLEPVGELAERMGAAVLCITHLNKGGASSSSKALHRFIGSIGFIAVARTAFIVTEDQEAPHRRLFLHAKNNLAPPPQGLAFTLEQRLVGQDRNIVASSVLWESAPVALTADEALKAPDGGVPSAAEECAAFLAELLADGPRPVTEIEQEARAACLLGAGQPISQSKPFRSARERLGIKPCQIMGQKAGGWIWALPGQMPSEGQVPS